jgi:hypothetical protein
MGWKGRLDPELQAPPRERRDLGPRQTGAGYNLPLLAMLTQGQVSNANEADSWLMVSGRQARGNVDGKLRDKEWDAQRKAQQLFNYHCKQWP